MDLTGVHGDGDDPLVRVSLRNLAGDDGVTLIKLTLAMLTRMTATDHRNGAYQLALCVQQVCPHLASRLTICEGVPVDSVQIRGGGRCRNDACVLVGRRFDALEERGHQEFGEEERSDDVRPPLKVVSFLRYLLNRRGHDASEKEYVSVRRS